LSIWQKFYFWLLGNARRDKKYLWASNKLYLEEHHSRLERYVSHISSSPTPDHAPSEDEVNQAPQHDRERLSEEKNATTWKLRQHVGTVLKCPELQEHTEPPIDCTRLNHLNEARFECIELNCIELNWIELHYNVEQQNIFSQTQSNLFTPTWMQPIRCCCSKTGEPTASLPGFRKVLSKLNRLFEILHPWLHAHYKNSRSNSLHSVRVKMSWLLLCLNCVLFQARTSQIEKNFFLMLTFILFLCFSRWP